MAPSLPQINISMLKYALNLTKMIITYKGDMSNLAMSFQVCIALACAMPAILKSKRQQDF